MPQDPEATLKRVSDYMRETRIMQSISALLDWDQQTGMPEAGAAWRSRQSEWLAGCIHRRQTDPRLGEWLSELSGTRLASDPHAVSGSTIRVLKHNFDKKSRLPEALVREQAAAHSLGQQVWVKARQTGNFDLFAPHLEKIVDLKREEAQATRQPGQCLYDPLLDDFEPGADTRAVHQVLTRLGQHLTPLMNRLDPAQTDRSAILRKHYPRAGQERITRQAAAAFGFDFQRGRQDTAAHPFCTELGPADIRMTTRFDERFLSSALFGTLHETGHGLYEQGLPEEHYGLPAGSYCSLGIHESQSRLWENLVGRSHGFWRHFLPTLATEFPAAVGDTPLDRFHAAVNEIRPSLIRVEADEVTYNLHIVIRVELEIALLDGDLQVGDLPGAWSELYRKYLGLVPDSAATGVLQDIHWSAGLFGYFATYTLGNLYASQLFARANADLGNLDEAFARGEFAPLLEWLRHKIHGRGACLPSAALMQEVTGSAIDQQPLLDHLNRKVSSLYSATS